MRRKVFVLLSLFCFTLATGVALGAEEEKLANPKTSLKKVAKALGKAKSFKVNCNVLGGISTAKDHSVSQVTVSEQYAGDFYKTVMRMAKDNAYRTPKSGAIQSGGQWYQLQALPHGKRIDFLFQFPQKVMANALKNPEKIEWVWVGDEVPEVEEEKQEGNTVVKWDKKETKGTPHVIRVTMPEKESVKTFVAVQNSGCMSGG